MFWIESCDMICSLGLQESLWAVPESNSRKDVIEASCSVLTCPAHSQRDCAEDKGHRPAQPI